MSLTKVRAQGSLENIDYDFNNVKLRAYHPDLEIIQKTMQNITMLYQEWITK